MRVLVVDDNPLVAEATAATLVAGGHAVEVAASAEAALDRHRPGGWDLVLTDLRLPGMDGWALVERLRILEPVLRVGLLTGWPPAEGEAGALARGACCLLTKPVDPVELLRQVELAGRAAPAAN